LPDLTENLQEKAITLTVPFSIPSENRKEEFTKDMERAAIICLAELERNKGGGMIIKQPVERTIYIAEVAYPFWLIPWKESTLLFDALSTRTHTFAYNALPDLKVLAENMQRSSKTFEAYMAFLSDHLNHFQGSSTENTINSSGLVDDPNFTNELVSWLRDGERRTEPLTDKVVLNPRLDLASILSDVHELDNLSTKFRQEITSVYDQMRLLEKTTNNFAKGIGTKIKGVREEFRVKIQKIEEITAPNVERIKREYDEKVTQLSQDFDKKLLPIQKEKAKIERNMDLTRAKIEHAKAEAKIYAAKKDKVSESRWRDKVNDLKKELSELNTKLKENADKTEQLADTRSIESFRLRSETETRTNEARKDILETESERDAQIQVYTEQLAKLNKSTATISSQMNNTAKMREAKLTQLETMGVKQERSNQALLYIAFYLVSYQRDSQRRYMPFAPSFANSIGLTAKIKGALGRPKIKQLLSDRFKSIAGLLSRLPSHLETNTMLEREIADKATNVDLLRSEVREQVKHGLEQLKEEGWLSEKESDEFSQLLS
jgi:hypothetical protein